MKFFQSSLLILIMMVLKSIQPLAQDVLRIEHYSISLDAQLLLEVFSGEFI